MDVLASALLLVAFILFVDLTFGEGNHVMAQLAGLFSSGVTLGWPTGIQEDDHPWVVAQRSLRPTSGQGTAAAWMPRQVGCYRAAARSSSDEWHEAGDSIDKASIEETADAVFIGRVRAGPTHLNHGRR